MESKRGQKSRLIKDFAKENPDMTCYQIAQALNVSAQSVYNNIEPRGNKVRQTKRDIVIEYLKNNPNEANSQVAKKLNVSINTVIKYANEIKGEDKWENLY